MDFKIKICGVTTIADARLAFELGADAIGLNFYPKSMRSIELDRAREITQSFAENHRPVWVGVFVNESPETINQIAEQVGLDFAQLHGDESPAIAAQIKSPIIRAVRVLGVDLKPAVKEIESWLAAGVAAVLLDKGNTTQYGGTGETLDWKRIAKLDFNTPLVLAGGLNPDNVSEAIAMAKPSAVDVASGVEKFPGAKDGNQMRNFVVRASKQFASR